jgi:hypothetical protein
VSLMTASHAALTVEIVMGQNIAIDSNVMASNGAGPELITLMVNYCNTGRTALTDVYANIATSLDPMAAIVLLASHLGTTW